MKTPDTSILEKVLDNEATVEKAKQVMRWFQTKEGQEWLSQRMDEDEAQIKSGNEEEWVDHEIPSTLMYQHIMNQIHRRKIRRNIFRAAAILLPFLFFMGLFFKIDNQIDLLSDSEQEEIIVPQGEKMRVFFQDGSSVYLNSGSSIRFPKKFTYNNREVTLNGEGWFEVQKNNNRPFIVILDRLNIKVLGTSFNVKAYSGDNDISVTLHKGLVELSSPDFYTFHLNPGDKATYNRTTRKCKINHIADLSVVPEWKNDIFVFKETPVNEVLKILSRAYNVTFQIQDKEVYKYTYTLKTKQKDISTTLMELEKIAPIHFLNTTDTIFVTLQK